MRSKPSSEPNVKECDATDAQSRYKMLVAQLFGPSLHLPSQKEGSGTSLQIQATYLPLQQLYKSIPIEQFDLSSPFGGQGAGVNC